ncbi:MAG: HAMP domain-containing sensor histidine kinase [bacterium]
MEQKLCLIVCSSFVSEVRYIINTGYYPDVIIKSVKSNCTVKKPRLDTIDTIIKIYSSEYSKVVFIGSSCAVGKKEKYKGYHNIEIILMGQCFELILNKSTIEHYISTKNYIVSNGWLKDYEKYIIEWGFDPATAKRFFKETADNVLLLDTGLPGNYLPQLEALTEYIGLPYEILPVGLSYCKLLIDSIVFQWREENERSLLNEKLANAASKSADYALAFNQLNNLVNLVDEIEVVEKIFTLLNMLYSPLNIQYTSINNNLTQEPVFFKKNVLIPKLYKNNSFQIELLNQEQTLGVFKVIGISFPQYIEKYKEMSQIIGKIGGLAISNARKFMTIKENEIRINKYSKELKELVASKDKFFSIIAHDLRSPFQGFMGMTEIMAEDISTFSQQELASISKEINNSANNLFKLLQNLLEWARMQQGAVSFIPKEINLSSMIVQNIEIISNRAKQKGINIYNELQNMQVIYADEKMLDSVIRNLLSNSVKFTKRGGKIIVNAQEIENDFVEISISDDGIGMSVELSNRLFRIEEKVGRAGTEGEPSTGLGLLLCKEFVEKNGGKIWVKSEEGKGSTFYFTLKILR